MVSLKRISVMVAALLVVLALASPLGVVFHEHDADAQAAGHANYDACHFRHLSAVKNDSAPVPSVPDFIARAVVAAHPDGERPAALGIRLTRGPPA